MAARSNIGYHGETIVVRPGDYFHLLLPDGTILNVEQTQDDFSIVRGNGVVAYTKPTSESAMKSDGAGVGGEAEQTTGHN